ncbi:MAG: UMP kinase [Bacteroidia bacterium]|nr:MAG: UMP kinase [Bacteroidia bacterium]
MGNIKYQRLLIKISGESLAGAEITDNNTPKENSNIFNLEIITHITKQIVKLIQLGVEVAIVIGAGNIFRGINSNDFKINRNNADSMGMLATIMNGIALKDFLANQNITSVVYSAIPIPSIVETYNRNHVLNDISQKKVIIFVAGTGHPFFTTDTGAALRAIEINADLLIKATKVDGVFNQDPIKYNDALKYDSLSFDEAITLNLKVMDMAAFDLCKNNNLNIQVCNIFKPSALTDIAQGKQVGTLVYCNNNRVTL